MGGEISPTGNGSPGRNLGVSFRTRLRMMAQARAKDPARAAIDTAEASIKAKERATENEPSTARGFGRRLRDFFIRIRAIASDPTGKTTEAVIEQTEEDREKVAEARRKHNEAKYGGEPTVAEVIIHGVGDLGDPEIVPPCTRRDLLVGGPKKAAKAAAQELAPHLLPWPLNWLAQLSGIFKWGSGSSDGKK